MKILIENINIDAITQEGIILDIETTGFSATNNMITILGYIIYDEDENTFYFYQYFAESLEDERILLMDFINRVKQNHKILTFNGIRFDIPFIEKRLEYHNINFNITENLQIDLYLYLKNNKIFTDIPATNQKQLENYMGLKRPFTMDGKIAVQYYKEYMDTHNAELYQKMSLYNKLDVLYLSELFDIYNSIEKIKTIVINHDGTHFKCIIQNLIKSKDKYNISLISNKQIFKYEVEDIKSHYKMNAYNNAIDIELHTITGLVSETKEGVCFNTEELSLDVFPASIYNLKRNYYILEDEDKHYIENIKLILTSILNKAIESFMI